MAGLCRLIRPFLSLENCGIWLSGAGNDTIGRLGQTQGRPRQAGFQALRRSSGRANPSAFALPLQPIAQSVYVA